MVGRRRHPASPWLAGLLLLAFAAPARADAPPAEPESAASEAAAWLDGIESSSELQRLLDATLESLREGDASLREQTLRIALLDLPVGEPPRLAHHNGHSPVYPASVVKFVYLMATYAWQEQGRLEIDAELDRQLDRMIHVSSNHATQRVVARLTETEPGRRLEPAEYRDFREKRHAVKRWLQGLGVDDLHAVHPTYDGGGDLHGRDLQFLEDPTVEGSLPDQTGRYRNRQAMTAVATAELLALLATDRALSPGSSAEVRRRMRRDPKQQPYLWQRIAGGAARAPDLDVYSKTGTWGPVYADAGIVRHVAGHQVVVVVFLEGRPRYRGSFIAELTRSAVGQLLEADRRSSRPLPGASRTDAPPAPGFPWPLAEFRLPGSGPRTSG
jgi:beta-lactamase class A